MNCWGGKKCRACSINWGKNHPKLVEEVIPNLIPLGTLVRVLSHLLREGVPIRDLRTILETIADHAATTKDADILTEVARQALGRTITKQYLAPDGSLPIIGLDPRLDRTLADQANAAGQGTQWVPDPLVAQKLLTALKAAAERMVGRGHQPVILCSPSLRRHLRETDGQNFALGSDFRIERGGKRDTFAGSGNRTARPRGR
jgi:flagellar biosynthesis protein FlhA